MKKYFKITTDEWFGKLTTVHRWTPMVVACHPEQQFPSLHVEGRLYSVRSWMQNCITEIVVNMSFPNFSIGNLKFLRPPTENFGGDKLIHPCSSVVKIFLILFLLLTASIYSQSEEKTNLEIMQENEAKVEKDRASREKEPLTGYDAETNSKKSIQDNNEKYSNFWVVGGSYGSPSGGNFNLGYYYKDIVLRASGMRYTPHWNGIQGDIGYSFWKTSVIAHSISLVFGQMNVRPFNPPYGGGDAGQNKYNRDGIVGYNHNPPTLTDNLIRAYITNQDPTLAALLEYQYRPRQYANFHQQYVGLTYDILVGGFFLQLGVGYGQGNYRNPQMLLQVGYLFDFGRKVN